MVWYCPLWAYALMALSWTSPKGLMSMEIYSLLINSWSFPKLANVGLPPNNPRPIMFFLMLLLRRTADTAQAWVGQKRWQFWTPTSHGCASYTADVSDGSAGSWSGWLSSSSGVWTTIRIPAPSPGSRLPSPGSLSRLSANGLCSVSNSGSIQLICSILFCKYVPSLDLHFRSKRAVVVQFTASGKKLC